MTRKTTAIIFILLVYFIILAHNVVPHHHHDEVAAIGQTETYYSNPDAAHHHNFPEHEHQHDDCLFVMRQTVVMSPNLGRLLDSDDGFTGNNGLDNFIFNTPDFLIVYAPPEIKIPFKSNPEHFITTGTCTFGLRAPPTIV